jgi:14-3-3 protein epsilon
MGDDANASARKQSLALAKLAEQAERYEEMVANMKDIINMGYKADELDQEERNLISVGYKNMMSVRRTSWRTVQSYEDKEEKAAEPDAQTLGLIKQYKETIASEIDGVIEKVARTHLSPLRTSHLTVPFSG